MLFNLTGGMIFAGANDVTRMHVGNLLQPLSQLNFAEQNVDSGHTICTRRDWQSLQRAVADGIAITGGLP